MKGELRRLLDAAFPGEEARYFVPMFIGNAPEHANEGAELILNGRKTLTSSPSGTSPMARSPSWVH